MRSDPSAPSAAPVPAPAPTPSPAIAPTASDPAAHPAPSSPDRITARARADGAAPAGPGDALADWAKSEWTSLAGAAHGLASAPGIVSQAWLDASATNARFAARITDAVESWDRTAPAARQAAIDSLSKDAASLSPAAGAIAAELDHANRAPLSGAPDGALPTGIAARASDVARALADAAGAQSGRASSALHAVSRLVGASPADVERRAERLTHAETGFSLGSVIKHTPYVGMALTAAATVHDSASVGAADATVANVGGTLAGEIAGELATTALRGVAGGVIADAGSAALGAAIATGPAGIAVVGGVVVGAAVGYGIYKAVESAPGQAAVHGVVQCGRSLVDGAVRELRG
jgi:hypothetical protein